MVNKRRWSPVEDSRLASQVRAFPQNLSKCFLIVAEETGRSPKAVAARWYQKVSKDPNNAAFVTVSANSKAVNRKNSSGTMSTPSVFRRILRILGIQ